jgi:hypothetical protein
VVDTSVLTKSNMGRREYKFYTANIKLLTFFKLEGVTYVARPTAITTSCTLLSTITYAKSSWTSKVNSFLYASPISTILYGILLHTSSHEYARYT